MVRIEIDKTMKGKKFGGEIKEEEKKNLI